MLSKLIHKYSLLSLILIISGCYLSKPEPGNNKSRDESAFEDYSAAVFLNEDKKFGDALNKINSAINKNDKIAKFFLLKAEILENSGKKIEALDAYKQVLKVQIYNPGVYEKMGELLASMGQYHSAIQNIKKAYAQKPRDTRLLVIAAKYYVMLKLYDRADSYLTTYESQTAPGDYTSDYYCIKAKVYFHDGKYDEVIDALDKCRTSKPLTTEYNKLYLNALLDSGKYDALYQYLAGLSPGVLTKGDELFYKGAYYFSKKNYRDALSQLKLAIRLKTEESRVYYYLGKVYYELGDLSKSKEMFDIFRTKTEKPELEDVQLKDMNQSEI